MSLYEEKPCEHGDVVPHGIGINARIDGRIDCPGGSRREVTVDYEAAMEQMRSLMPDDWEREPWPMAFVQLIVDAAVGVEKET